MKNHDRIRKWWPCHVCHPQTFCHPLLSAVLLRKLTNKFICRAHLFFPSEYRFYSKECLPQISASLRVNERHSLLHYTTHYGNAALIRFIVILTIVHVNGMNNWNRIQTFKTYFRHFLTCCYRSFAKQRKRKEDFLTKNCVIHKQTVLNERHTHKSNNTRCGCYSSK